MGVALTSPAAPRAGRRRYAPHLAEGPSFPARAARLAKVSYEVAFVTHACMEPMNATVLVREDGTAEAWMASQSPASLRWGVQRGGWTGLDLSEVNLPRHYE